MDLASPHGSGPATATAATAPSATWSFPVYVGHRRRLHPGDELYDDAPYSHDDRGRAAAIAAARDTPTRSAAERTLRRDWLALAPKHECASCKAVLPTAHLLDLHVAEVHDSFFAAQAARRLPVFACLVESCDRKFSSVEQRKQHLIDHHKFPKGGNLDRIHLRRKKAQVRPLPEYRKGGGRGRGQGAHAAPAPAAAPTSAAEPAAAPETDAMAVDDVLAAGMSRLSMAAQISAVPRSVAFGRRRGGRAMPGLGRGRGGGSGRGRGGEGGDVAPGAEGGGQGGMEEG